MRYKRRELRRLWEVKVYEGNPDDKPTRIRRGTVIAFNAVEALRLCGGRASEQPREMFYVTWPETDDGPIFQIEDTSGPFNEIPVVASIAPAAPVDDFFDEVVEEPKPEPKKTRVKRRFKPKAIK